MRSIDKNVTVEIKEESIERVLDIVLDGTDITYRIHKKQIMLIPPKDNRPVSSPMADSGRDLDMLVEPNVPVPNFTLLPIQDYALQVSGTVTDENGAPLPGVNVMVKGTTLGTVTDVNGKYTLSAPDENATLIFSFIGYLSQEIAISSRTVVDAVMQPDIKTLSEVVVVGYGTTKKSDLYRLCRKHQSRGYIGASVTLGNAGACR